MAVNRIVSLLFLGIYTLLLLPVAALGADTSEFSGWIENIADDGPGCAVSVRQGKEDSHFFRGLSNLEHHTPIDPSTVFEAGSVAKQFTAAATILLSLDGKLNLDDPVSKHFPELPDYADNISVRMLMHHNSGLRDWGVVASIAGMGRFERIFNNHDVIDILSRQKSLNHLPGQYFSYTNSGYSLLAILIERASGMSFDEYTAKHIFEPLGMERTEWRSNFNRVVVGRATAYQRKEEQEWEAFMPFENVVGNGGLITTTQDLLKFSNALHYSDELQRGLKEEMYRIGELTSVQPMTYAGGLFVGSLDGRNELSHGGSTAGYRAFLVDYPDDGLTVAILCNRTDASTGKIAREIAKVRLAKGDDDVQIEPGAPSLPNDINAPAPSQVTAHVVGGYQIASTGQVIDVHAHGDTLILFGQKFHLEKLDRYVSENGMTFKRERESNNAVFVNSDGQTFHLRFYETWNDHDLAEYTGFFRNEEAPSLYRIDIIDGKLYLEIPGNPRQMMVPTHKDQFLVGPRQTRFTFLRDGEGKVSAARLSTNRVWNMHFSKS